MTFVAKNISVERRGTRVLDDVSLALEGGQLIGLIGPNGAGKSTLLRVMAGLLPPIGGHVTLDGKLLSEITSIERAHKLAFMPQEHIVSWPISVFDLVALGRLPFQHPLSRLNEESKEAIASALAAMNIESLAHRPATELSGGELARVLLARALAQRPQILLADEPAAGLDPAHKLNLLTTLARISNEGMSVVVVLHDLTMAARFCDHLVLLDQGRVYGSGKPLDVLTNRALSEVYHISAHIDRAGGQAGGAPVITPLEVEEAGK